VVDMLGDEPQRGGARAWRALVAMQRRVPESITYASLQTPDQFARGGVMTEGPLIWIRVRVSPLHAQPARHIVFFRPPWTRIPNV